VMYKRCRSTLMKSRAKAKRAAEPAQRWREHRLYGRVPLVRHETVVKGKTYEWWQCDPAFKPRLPRGALAGDVTKQDFCPCHPPKYFYLGETRCCIQCGDDFPFSASEQKYWYEVRKFNFHSVPVRCPECRRRRRSEHALREQIAQARRAVEEEPRSAAAHLALARAIVEYHERTGAGRLDDAVAAARKAAKLRPEGLDAALWARITRARAARSDRR